LALRTELGKLESMRKHKNKRFYLCCTARGDRSKITKQEHPSVHADSSGRKNRLRPNPQVHSKLQSEHKLIAALVREQETEDASTKNLASARNSE
jgi:hypothetical protein